METYIVIENGRLMFAAYIPFFILALITRRTDNVQRRKAGNLMLGASLPGMAICVYVIGLFAYATIRIYHAFSTGVCISVNDVPALRQLEHACNDQPLGLLWLSILLIPIEGIFCWIGGVKARNSGSAKVISVISIINGIAMIAFTGFLTLALIQSVAD